MANKNNMPRFRLAIENGTGRGAHMIKDKIRAIAGDKINKAGVASRGSVSSLIMSLRPSANGCSSPRGPTMLGPLRSCI